MDKIRFDFQNIGLLEKASLDVNVNSLNIKYGSNGIGKTTIIKALKYKYGVEGNDEDLDSSDCLNSIVSLNDSNKKPVVTSDGVVSSTLVYDRHYFSMLFENELDVLNDTYRLVVKSKEYEKALNQLRSGISSIVNYASDSNFDSFIQKYKTIVPSVKSSTVNLVAWNCLCESFHVETQYIYSIIGISDQDIPNYIISLCDSIISKIRPFALK